MPKGIKRKREDEDDPQPRRSNREMKRTSFGEDFVELFSPPKNPTSSKGPSQSGPSTSSSGGGQELSQNRQQTQLPGRAHQASGGNHFPQIIVSYSIFFVSDHRGLVSALCQRCTKYFMCINISYWGGIGMVSVISAHAFLVSDNWYLISDQNLSSSGVLLWLVYFEV